MPAANTSLNLSCDCDTHTHTFLTLSINVHFTYTLCYLHVSIQGPVCPVTHHACRNPVNKKLWQKCKHYKALVSSGGDMLLPSLVPRLYCTAHYARKKGCFKPAKNKVISVAVYKTTMCKQVAHFTFTLLLNCHSNYFSNFRRKERPIRTKIVTHAYIVPTSS